MKERGGGYRQSLKRVEKRDGRRGGFGEISGGVGGLGGKS